MSIATAIKNHKIQQHNKKIVEVEYSNSKIRKGLFYFGLVIPDFKISWGILVLYLVRCYPIPLKKVIRFKILDLYLFVIRGVYRL